MHTEKIVVVTRIYLLQHRANAIKKDSNSANWVAICSINIGGKY